MKNAVNRNSEYFLITDCVNMNLLEANFRQILMDVVT